MLELTKNLISGIEQGESEAILGAEEVAVFLTFGIENSGLVEPYLSQLRETPATEEDGKELRKSLARHLKENGVQANPSAIWALGKFHNPEDSEILREQLAIHLECCLKHSSAMYNALDALSRCGENTMSRSSSGTIYVENNIKDARLYLKKFGKEFPW